LENTHRDESNDILYDIIYLCILIEKYDQSMLCQNCKFLNRSSIAGRREYIVFSLLKIFAYIATRVEVLHVIYGAILLLENVQNLDDGQCGLH